MLVNVSQSTTGRRAGMLHGMVVSSFERVPRPYPKEEEMKLSPSRVQISSDPKRCQAYFSKVGPKVSGRSLAGVV
jgi:hypothetical protein